MIDLFKISKTSLSLLIFLIVGVCLIVTLGTPFPFIVGQNFSFRLLTLLALPFILFCKFDLNEIKRSYYLRWFFIYFIIVSISGLFGLNPENSFWSTLERMQGIVNQLHLLIFGLILTVYLKSEEDVKRLCLYTIYVTFLVSFGGLLIAFSSKYSIGTFGYFDSTFGNRSYTGNFIVNTLFLIGVYQLFIAKSLRPSKEMFILLFVFLLALFFTFNRGSYLAVFVGLVVFLLTLLPTLEGELSKKIKKITYFVITATIFSLISLSVLSLFIENRELQRFNIFTFTENMRFLMWKIAWKGFLDDPFWGAGLENFFYIFNKYFDPQYIFEEEWVDYAHNVFVEHLVTTGIFGFLAYTSLYILMTVQIKKSSLSNFQKSLFYAILAQIIIRQFFVFEAVSGQIQLVILFTIMNFYIHKSKNIETVLEVESKKKSLSNKSKKEMQKSNSENIKIKPILVVITAYLFVAIPYAYKFVISEYNSYVSYKNILSDRRENLYQKLDRLDYLLSQEIVQKSTLNFAYLISVGGLGNNKTIPQDLAAKVFNLGVRYSNQAINSDPLNVKYYVLFAQFLYQFGSYDYALENLFKAIQLSPNKQKTMMHVVQVYLLKGDLNNALVWAKKIYDLGNYHRQIVGAYITLLQKSGNQQLANEIAMKHKLN